MSNKNIKGIFIEKIGRGHPVIVSTGGPKACGNVWRNKLKPLSEFSNVIFWDYRGCGKSALSETYSMNQDLNDLNQIVESLEVSPILLGHSYGGMLIQKYALKYPDKVSGLALVNTISSSKVYAKVNIEKQANLKSLNLLDEWSYLGDLASKRESTPKEEMRYWEIELNNHLYDKSYIQYVLKNMEVNFDALMQMQSDISIFSTVNELTSISIPTLIIAGKHDYIVLDEPRKISEMIKNSTYVEFEKSGHMPFVEETQKFSDVVKNWMNSLKLD